MRTYLSVLVSLGLMVLTVRTDEFYDGKWNNIDTRAIVNNDRAFARYKACIIDPSSPGCPEESVQLGKVLPEALRERCAKCSPVQTERIKDTLSYICEKRPADFTEVLAKIDPGNKYRPAFEEKLGKLHGGC